LAFVALCKSLAADFSVAVLDGRKELLVALKDLVLDCGADFANAGSNTRAETQAIAAIEKAEGT